MSFPSYEVIPLDEEPFTLGSMAPRRRRPWLIPAICIAVVALLAGGVGLAYGVATGTKQQTPAAATSARPDASTHDPAGWEACSKLKLTAASTGTASAEQMQPVVAWGKQSRNDSIKIQSGLLANAIDLAIASRGQADEVRQEMNLGKYQLDLVAVCIEQGYPH